MSDMAKARALWLLFSASFKKQIAVRFDANTAKSVIKRAKSGYFEIVRNPPLIGAHNPKLIDILFTAFVVSVYKAGEAKFTPEMMGKIMTDSVESVYLFRKFCTMGNHFCSEWQDKRNAQAVISQKRENPDDFVCEFIYGKTCDEYGINYYECALYKLLKRENCAELTPLMCNFDYVMAKYMNAELKRTKTLASGAELCDFWYSKRK